MLNYILESFHPKFLLLFSSFHPPSFPSFLHSFLFSFCFSVLERQARDCLELTLRNELGRRGGRTPNYGASSELVNFCFYSAKGRGLGQTCGHAVCPIGTGSCPSRVISGSSRCWTLDTVTRKRGNGGKRRMERPRREGASGRRRHCQRRGRDRGSPPGTDGISAPLVSAFSSAHRPLKSPVVTEFFLSSDEKLIEKSKSPPQMIHKKCGRVHIFLRKFSYGNS